MRQQVHRAHVYDLIFEPSNQTKFRQKYFLKLHPIYCSKGKCYFCGQVCYFFCWTPPHPNQGQICKVVTSGRQFESMAQDFGDRAFRDRRRFFPQNFPSTFFSSGNHLISNVTSDKDNSTEPMFEKSWRRPLLLWCTNVIFPGQALTSCLITCSLATFAICRPLLASHISAFAAQKA